MFEFRIGDGMAGIAHPDLFHRCHPLLGIVWSYRRTSFADPVEQATMRNSVNFTKMAADGGV